jgi:hypothetical protein
MSIDNTPESRHEQATEQPTTSDAASKENERRTAPQSPSSSSSSSSSTKSVSFLEDKTVIEIPHHKDITRKIKRDLWLESYEYNEMMGQNKSVANKIIRGKQLHKGETGRGLDSFIPKRAYKRDRSMEDAICTVLNEQNRQRKEGKVIPELLSEIYSNVARESHDWAVNVAKEDELEASLSLEEMNSKSRKRQGIISKKVKGMAKALRISRSLS